MGNQIALSGSLIVISIGLPIAQSKLERICRLTLARSELERILCVTCFCQYCKRNRCRMYFASL